MRRTNRKRLKNGVSNLIIDVDRPFEIETVFVEEQDRLPEEFQQLEDSDEVAETFNLVSGSVSTTVGQSQASQQTIAPEVNRVLDAPEVRVDAPTISSALSIRAVDSSNSTIPNGFKRRWMASKWF